MVMIHQVTRFHVFGQVFNSVEAAQEHCEEKLAEKICEHLCKGVLLAPGDKLKVLANIHRLTALERQAFADLFVVHTEEEC